MKKMYLFLSIFLFGLFSSVFALGPDPTVPSKIFGFATALAGIVMGISMLMIIMSGFFYVTSVGDERAADKAKETMMSAFVGFFISMVGFFIVKIFSKSIDTPAKETQPAEYHPGLTLLLVFGIPIFLIILAALTSKYIKSPSSSNKQVKVKPLISISDVEEVLEELNGYEPDFMDGNSVNFIVKNMKVHYQFVYSNSILVIRNDSEKVMDSSYSMDENKIISLDSKVELDSKHEILIGQIHERFAHVYLKENSTIEKWVNYLLSKLNASTVKNSIKDVLSLYEEILPFGYQLDEEKRFFLEETFLRDTELLIDSYLHLSDEQRALHSSSIIEKVNILKEHLSCIQKEMDSKGEKDLLYVFRIIEKKYGQENNEIN